MWVMALGGEEVRRRVELVGSGLIRMKGERIDTDDGPHCLYGVQG